MHDRRPVPVVEPGSPTGLVSALPEGKTEPETILREPYLALRAGRIELTPFARRRQPAVEAALSKAPITKSVESWRMNRDQWTYGLSLTTEVDLDVAALQQRRGGEGGMDILFDARGVDLTALVPVDAWRRSVRAVWETCTRAHRVTLTEEAFSSLNKAERTLERGSEVLLFRFAAGAGALLMSELGAQGVPVDEPDQTVAPAGALVKVMDGRPAGVGVLCKLGAAIR